MCFVVFTYTFVHRYYACSKGFSNGNTAIPILYWKNKIYEYWQANVENKIQKKLFQLIHAHN